PITTEEVGKRAGGCRCSPWIIPLQASSCCGIIPLRLTWQKSSVPDAEGVALVPVHVVDGTVLVHVGNRRPGGPRFRRLSRTVRRIHVAVPARIPTRFERENIAVRQPVPVVQVPMLASPCIGAPVFFIPRRHELPPSTH